MPDGIYNVRQQMRAFLLLVTLLVAGCAPTYIDSPDVQPRLAARAPKTPILVRIRTMPFGRLKSTLVDSGYCIEAIYLAEHSRRKVAANAPRPVGTGYLIELVQNDEVVDWFEFWRDEIVVHGQRWEIEDKKFAARERMVWFGEIH